jgi:cytochrome b6-f complex iron-sulfur subunit
MENSNATAGDPRPAEAPAGRRKFLGLLTKAFLALWGVGGLGLVATYLRPPENEEESFERMVRVGMLAELRVGEARLVRHGVRPFYVIRLDTARVIAVSAVCTHVRCILGFDRERRALICPCHQGRFDLSGNVVSGPPPRPLATYEVLLRAGEIYVRV